MAGGCTGTSGDAWNLSVGFSGPRCPEPKFSAYLTWTAFKRERAGLPAGPDDTDEPTGCLAE